MCRSKNAWRDGRTLDHKTLEEIQRMAVRRVREGEKPSVVIASFGFNRPVIYKWLKAAAGRGRGLRALRSTRGTGRPRSLTAAQERQVFRWVNGRDPRQFLDEIDSLPFSVQGRLLRVVQEGEYERVGGKQVLRAEVRIIAAANRGLDHMVKSREFRQDLYYRLNVVPIHIPPLRERRDDISALTDHILRRLAAKYSMAVKTLSERTWIRVMAYEWPGNVRELENVLERSFLFATGPVIEDLLIDMEGRRRDEEAASDDFALRIMKRRAAMDMESKVLREALLRCEGNVTAAAREMGITPRAVHQKLKSHSIDPASYRRRAMAQISAD